MISLLLLFACGPELPRYGLLGGPRLLAVRADAPTLFETETTVVDALTYDPDGDPVDLAWSWCPWVGDANSGYACAVSEEDFAAAVPSAEPYDLGTDPTATWSYDVAAADLQAFCTASANTLPPPKGASFPPECTDRMQIWFRAVAGIGDESIEAVKEVTLAFDDGVERNVNPTLDRVLLDGTSFDASPTVASEDTIAWDAIPVNGTAQESAELGRTEELLWSWFSSAGDSEWQRTGTIDGDVSIDDASKNEWTAPDEAGDVDFAVVLRDERGGVDWLLGSATVD
jgi:hypothetical protein